MLRIERMRMLLPKGFEHRASTIARLVGESIAELHPAKNLSLDRLSIGPVQIWPNATDQEIAHSIAERISAELGAET